MMVNKNVPFLACLSVIILISGCRGLLEKNVNLLESDASSSVLVEGEIIKERNTNATKGFLIYSEELFPKTVSYSMFEDNKTKQVYKKFNFSDGVGESIEIYTKRSTEILNLNMSVKRFAKNWKIMRDKDLLWGKDRFYDSNFSSIKYRAAKIKNHDTKCIFFQAKGMPAKKDHFDRPHEIVLGYYCLQRPLLNLGDVKKIFDGFTIEGRSLKQGIFDVGNVDTAALKHYHNEVDYIYSKAVPVYGFPLNISEKVENQGSLLSD